MNLMVEKFFFRTSSVEEESFGMALKMLML
jgi:hypothetical protein